MADNTSLSTSGARTLATTTKTAPQMRGISPRWLLEMLPWVETQAGVYQVNRRHTYDLGVGRVGFDKSGPDYEVKAEDLAQMPLLHGFDDPQVLDALAQLFTQQEFAPGEMIIQADTPIDQLVLLAHGRANELSVGEYGEVIILRRAGDGDYYGDGLLAQGDNSWAMGLEAITTCVVLTCTKDDLWALIDGSAELQAHIAQQLALQQLPQDKFHQPEVEMIAGLSGEPLVPNSFISYELGPRQIELSVAQAILRVHTRVADLYNDPMDQFEHQLRLTIEALRERQEYELINDPQFGLLSNVDHKQRLFAQPGVPSADEVDCLLCRCRRAHFLLAHPRTIAAFHRECSRLAISTQHVEVHGRRVASWRGIPILPCDKIPISDAQTSSILCLRVGEDMEGVVGLRQSGIPDEVEPSLNVRFMGIDDKAVTSYLVSSYYSAAVLVPTALNVLEGVSVVDTVS